MYGALLVFDSDFIHIVSISFTALIVTELIMVALTIHTWHWAMLLAQVYICSYPQLSNMLSYCPFCCSEKAIKTATVHASFLQKKDKRNFELLMFSFKM